MLTVRRVAVAVVALGLAAVASAGVTLWNQAGGRAYVVHTGSMTGSFDSGDLIIDRQVTGPLHVGEVITFLHSGLSTDVVTHRIVGLRGGTIQTKGDANPTPDVWNIRHDQVKGVVATSIPKAGYVVYFFKQRAGDAAAMTGVLALILLYGLFFAPTTAAVKDTKQRADDTNAGIATEADLDSLPPLAQAIERLRRGQSLGSLTIAGASAARSL